MASRSEPSLPSPKVIHVDTRGAVILTEESPEVCQQLLAGTGQHTKQQ